MYLWVNLLRESFIFVSIGETVVLMDSLLFRLV